MNALTIFIRRPVLATMLTTLLLVLGLFSYADLGVDLIPKVEAPVVFVTTVLRGASPEEIESQVSKPIEEVVNTISGIDELSSYSMEGRSRVVIRFMLDRDMAEAVQDVRDKVASVQDQLPEGTEIPVVSKVDFDAQPVLTLSVSGDRDLDEVSEVARLKVKEAIESADGVGAVEMIGGRIRAINVILDVERLQALGIPIAQVKAALATQNVEIPSGRIDRGDSEQVLRTLARVERLEDFAGLVVTTREGRQVRIGDIGRVEDTIEEPRSLARIWLRGDEGLGRPSVSMDVIKQSGENTVQVIAAVKRRLAEIEPTLPASFRIQVVSDQSEFIVRSLDELNLHLILGSILAALAVLFFMRNWRSTVIAAVAIPTSLIASFTMMRALDFTLNNMTLLGLTLAVGIVIDDAIVVLENIFRHMEEYGKSAFEAAVDGLKEIGLAVMATTTSLIIIFIPVAFMEGMTGRFFYEFGLTTACAIAVSLIVSFTLTPMLSARFLRIKHAQDVKGREHGRLDRSYRAMIRWALAHRWVVVLCSLLIVGAVVPLLALLGKDFMPLDDRSEFRVSLIAPAGSSLSAVSDWYAKIESRIHELPEVRLTLSQMGSTAGGEDVTDGSIYVAITDIADRDVTQFDVMRQVRRILADFPELRSSVNALGGMGGGSRSVRFQYNLTGPDLESLMKHTDLIMSRLRETPGFVDVDSSLSSRKPEVRVNIDRDKAADLGIVAADIAGSLRTMVGGEAVSKFRDGVEQFDVWVRLDRRDRSDAEVIEQLPLMTAKAGLVPLGDVARLSDGRGPTEIRRFQRQRLATIYANLDGLDMGGATQKLGTIVQELQLPTAYRSSFMGQTKMMNEAMQQMVLAFVMAFIFMYIILAAQFESFVHPITILLSLPLTLPFALLSLLVLGETLNVYSLLGVFMLFGIVKKNGILQIDYTNTLRGRGMPLQEAILEANHARLRPILMTTVTLIAGMTPIALGTGPGAAARASMAKVIIGGQALSLLITLLIVPVAYSLFEGAKARLGIGQDRAD